MDKLTTIEPVPIDMLMCVARAKLCIEHIVNVGCKGCPLGLENTGYDVCEDYICEHAASARELILDFFRENNQSNMISQEE